MKAWELAPANAGVIAGKKIPFAITLSDLKNKSDFWKNLRKAIENGLTEEDAIKALTYSPAQFLKIDDQIGSLKNSMLANFIITSTNLTNKDNQIFENWINGKDIRSLILLSKMSVEIILCRLITSNLYGLKLVAK
ncbi:MAG: amidohydrolase family protein [Bacteroidetes bacterium]|nr:amidohydrolase family protein [Bacteroidota bacterium]